MLYWPIRRASANRTVGVIGFAERLQESFRSIVHDRKASLWVETSEGWSESVQQRAAPADRSGERGQCNNRSSDLADFADWVRRLPSHVAKRVEYRCRVTGDRPQCPGRNDL